MLHRKVQHSTYPHDTSLTYLRTHIKVQQKLIANFTNLAFTNLQQIQ